MATSNTPTSKSTVKKAAKPTTKETPLVLVEKPTSPAQEKAKKAKTAAVAKKPVETKKATTSAKQVAAEKTTKLKKPKLVRDSFTIPKDEYVVIDGLKQRAATLGQPMKKSELLRAGIKMLNSLGDEQLKQALAQVPAIKTGRPKG